MIILFLFGWDDVDLTEDVDHTVVNWQIETHWYLYSPSRIVILAQHTVILVRSYSPWFSLLLNTLWFLLLVETPALLWPRTIWYINNHRFNFFSLFVHIDHNRIIIWTHRVHSLFRIFYGQKLESYIINSSVWKKSVLRITHVNTV